MAMKLAVCSLLLTQLCAVTAQAQANSPLVRTATISVADLERVVENQGVHVKSAKVRDLLLRVEGVDAQGRKVELMVDRRTGEILSRQLQE